VLKTSRQYLCEFSGLDLRYFGSASLCIECGKCAKHCPQQIAVPTELKSVKSALGGGQTKLMISLIKRMMPFTPAKSD